ncbi:MAG: type IV pilus secretin PilQ [Desulfobacterales bacterium]|nr:type IV pilus secretin PilQ [Desulfobacterales bacterium]
MSYKNDRVAGIGILLVGLLAWSTMFTGCIAPQHVKTGERLIDPSSSSKVIKGICSVLNPDSIDILIQGNKLLTYTSIKQPFPRAVVLYFPDTVIDGIDISELPENDIISGIHATKLGENDNTSRIEIVLKKDAVYDVSRDGTTLDLSFARSAQRQMAGETEKKPGIALNPAEGVTVSNQNKPLSDDNQLQTITVERLNSGLKIMLNARKPVLDYKSFTIKSGEGKPARIVFDISRLQSPFSGEQTVDVDTRWVRRIRHYGDSGNFRLVLDTYDPYLGAAAVHPVDAGLEIFIGTETTVSDAAAEKIDSGPLNVLVTSLEARREKNQTQAPVWINRIDFSAGDEGKSTLVIGSTRPVNYEINKVSDKLLQLKLYNSNLADYRQRALITTRFESAVDRIIPIQTPEMKNVSMVSIELREAVPYHVEQTASLLNVHFDASSIPPKPFEDAGLPAWKQVVARVADDRPLPPLTESEPSVNAVSKGKKYTGEKIALDFYDTDIKNVFRILMEVSGKNFAIDKEVSGKVTLSLDKPVPWDQVMDLILRMNQLNSVMEGDIIRIATIATLKKEEDARRARLASEQKTKEQVKAVEPLVTEYISVNYSTANDLIKHLETIISKDRGSISVDERTNQIVLTDVAETIRKAKEIVNHLDMVTPQVMIEARIVEASSDIAKEIGTSWSADGGIENTADNAGLGPQRGFDTLGGTYGWNLAMNLPLVDETKGGSIGVNFSRILGSPLTISAKLMALETENDIKIISAPRIITLDNKMAKITQGLEYPYQVKDEDGSISVEYKDINLTLEVTPHITPDNRINMILKIEKNDVAGVLSTGEPFISIKEAETELLVEDGDTLVIGGIIRSKTDESKDSVPGLSKVPGFGWLFKSNSDSNIKEELLIFITPRIVKMEQRAL